MNTFAITCLNNGAYEAQHNQSNDVYLFLNKGELVQFLDAYYKKPICALFAYDAINSL